MGFDSNVPCKNHVYYIHPCNVYNSAFATSSLLHYSRFNLCVSDALFVIHESSPPICGQTFATSDKFYHTKHK